jgi:FixJ family two-component response regulator
MTDEKPIVYVVDDDPSVLKSLDRLLRSAGYDVTNFASAFEFLDFPHPDVPGCLILDVKMPKLSGLELQEHLADKEISCPIIFITGHGTIPMSVRAMKAGAVDFLEKPFEGLDLLNAISRAIAKDRQTKRDQKELKELRKRLETLTSREYDVFGLIVVGKLNKQIAFDLGISEKTVKVHRARIFSKMGAASLADLVRFAENLRLRSTAL